MPISTIAKISDTFCSVCSNSRLVIRHLLVGELIWPVQSKHVLYRKPSPLPGKTVLQKVVTEYGNKNITAQYINNQLFTCKGHDTPTDKYKCIKQSFWSDALKWTIGQNPRSEDICVRDVHTDLIWVPTPFSHTGPLLVPDPYTLTHVWTSVQLDVCQSGHKK